MIEPHCKIGKVTPKLRVVEPLPVPVNYSAVAHAERLLKGCVEGDFQTIGVVAVTRDNQFYSAYALGEDCSAITLNGGISWLSDRLLDTVREEL